MALARVTLTSSSASAFAPASAPILVPSPVPSPVSPPVPVDWEDNPEHARRSHQDWLHQTSLEYPDIVSRDESGRYIIRSRFVPSPAERNAPYRGKEFISVMRGEGRNVQFQDIIPDDLPEFEANG